MITRRGMMAGVAAGALTMATARFSWAETRRDFTLPELPYPVDALEPFIDAETMTIHHSRHHKAYVDNLVKALTAEAPEWLNNTIEFIVCNYQQLPESIRTTVRNNGGGHYNHSLFWTMMTPAAKSGKPSAELQKAIDETFNGMEEFKKAFAAKAVGQFGSGWGWLVLNRDKRLTLVSTPNQDNPLTDGMFPLLGIDVWEHAYYLKYQNKRADYIQAWFNVINWERVNALYADIMK